MGFQLNVTGLNSLIKLNPKSVSSILVFLLISELLVKVALDVNVLDTTLLALPKLKVLEAAADDRDWETKKLILKIQI